VDYIEKWRIEFGNKMNIELKDFYLMGHSFGGYICGNYALKYPENVRKVILLSPIGIKLSEAAIDDVLSV
jgi:pimeloyl-ACP methyl ester carboxylesterase